MITVVVKLKTGGFFFGLAARQNGQIAKMYHSNYGLRLVRFSDSTSRHADFHLMSKRFELSVPDTGGTIDV